MPHMDKSISKRFPILDIDELPDDLRARAEQMQEKSGFVPNVMLGITRRPAEMRAFFEYHDSIMDRQTPALSKAEREMIVVVSSGLNDCLYCVVAHGAIARIRSKNPYISDQLATDWRKADLDDRMRAVMAVVEKLTLAPNTVADEDIESLRAHGLDDEDVYDVGSITAFFSMSNRLAHFGAMMPNPEFYLMGRVPREKS